MWPIDWGALSTADSGPGIERTVRAAHKATAYSTSSSQMSAFALRYILFLRSCRLMDGFVIPSLPPLWSEKRQQQGAFAPRALPRLNATTRPSATLSSSTHFPVLPVIGPTLLRQFPAGTRRASPVARSVLVIVPPLPPRRSGPAVSISFRPSMPPSPSGCGLGLRNVHFRGHLCVHLRCGPMTRCLPMEDIVDRLQKFGFPPPCYPSYGRVGRWRGALRVRCTGPRAFASASIPVPIRSVSTPRSSNRTCGTTAFGSQLGSRLRPRKVPGLRRKAREAAFLPQPRVGKAHVFPRPHLVLPPEPLS